MSDYFYSLESLLLRCFRGEYGYNTLIQLIDVMPQLANEENQ